MYSAEGSALSGYEVVLAMARVYCGGVNGTVPVAPLASPAKNFQKIIVDKEGDCPKGCHVRGVHNKLSTQFMQLLCIYTNAEVIGRVFKRTHLKVSRHRDSSLAAACIRTTALKNVTFASLPLCVSSIDSVLQRKKERPSESIMAVDSEAIFVLPGDHIDPDVIPSHPKKALKLGPGLRHVPPSDLIPTVAGQLISDPRKNSIWVEYNGGRVSSQTYPFHLP